MLPRATKELPWPFSAWAKRFRQLQQVVNRADQTPFALDLLKTSHEELSEATRLFDLPKHRFDGLLAQPVATASSGSRQGGAHRGDPFTAARTVTGRRGCAVAARSPHRL